MPETNPPISKSLAYLNNVREKSLRWKSHASKLNKWHYFCAELLGTATFMFMGCSGCLVNAYNERPMTEKIAVNFGFAMMCTNMIFAHISQGHFNPTLTIASMVLKQLAVIDAFVYFAAQFCGAFLGYGVVFMIQNRRQREKNNSIVGVGLCSPKVSSDISVAQGFAVEFFISFILSFFACVRWEQYRNWHDSLSLTFGVVYICLIVAAFDYTEGHMNPARTVAPAVINWDWSRRDWIYYVAPIAAAILAPLLYRIFIPKSTILFESPQLMTRESLQPQT